MKTESNHDRFKKILVNYIEDLFRYAVFLTRNEHQAEDLASETLLIALEKSDSLRDETKIKAWLFKILTNLYLCEKRNRKIQQSIQGINNEEPFSLYEQLKKNKMLWEESPEKGFINKLLRDDLQKAIDSLPEQYRQAVILNDVERMSYMEIAIIMNVQIGTVRSRISRGRSLLQKKLWRVAKEMNIKPNLKKPEIICDCGESDVANSTQSLSSILQT